MASTEFEHLRTRRICRQIGLIGGTPLPFSRLLCEKIAATGKRLDDLTIGELIRLRQATTCDFKPPASRRPERPE